jgi:cytoskeleton protein RodZ
MSSVKSPQEAMDTLDSVAEASAELVAVAAPPPPPSAGQMLQAAREAQSLSLSEVAKALKLSQHQVEALEANDWSSLPCNTVIRGFVRNYARMLGLNPGELMAALDAIQMPKNAELEMSPGINVSVPQENSAQRRDYARVIVGFVALALAASVYFFLPDHVLDSALSMLQSAVQSSEPPAAKDDASNPAENTALPAATMLKEATEAVPQPPVVSPDTKTMPSATSTSAAPEVKAGAAAAASAPAATASAPAATASAPAAAGSGLKFTFAQPSWVEVRDRSGEIIFSQLSQAGSQREIEGQPPFALVIGNATHVNLQYKGKAVDLSKRSKDDVARVTVE